MSDDYIDNIKTLLTELKLEKYLEYFIRFYDTYSVINNNFYLELIILAHEKDLFAIHEDNSVLNILKQLHLIDVVKVINGDPPYVVTKLTPFGHLFTDHYTNIKKVSDRTFKKYHKIMHQQMHAVTSVLFTIIYLILMVTNCQLFVSAKLVLTKIIIGSVSFLLTVGWAWIIRHIHFFTTPKYVTNTLNVYDQYQNLCNFICSKTFRQYADPYREHVNQAIFLKIMIQHPSIYVSNVDLSTKNLEELLWNMFSY